MWNDEKKKKITRVESLHLIDELCTLVPLVRFRSLLPPPPSRLSCCHSTHLSLPETNSGCRCPADVNLAWREKQKIDSNARFIYLFCVSVNSSPLSLTRRFPLMNPLLYCWFDFVLAHYGLALAVFVRATFFFKLVFALHRRCIRNFVYILSFASMACMGCYSCCCLPSSGAVDWALKKNPVAGFVIPYQKHSFPRRYW